MVITDYEGAPAAIVDFTFTNNSEEDTSFAVACSQKVFQNGVQFENALVSTGWGDSPPSGMRTIRKGPRTGP